MLTSENLGPCCACEIEGPDVKNFILLNFKGIMPGMGWGCLECGLPMDGAIAVICDGCQKSNRQVKYAARGYPGAGERYLIADNPTQYHGHIYQHHPDDWIWHDSSPDVGPDCYCSACQEPIETMPVIRLFDETSNKEARFHHRCFYGTEVEWFKPDNT